MQTNLVHFLYFFYFFYNKYCKICAVDIFYTLEINMENLKILRNQYKLTQNDLSKKLNISRVNLSRYENGEVEPNFETLIKIANYFDVSVDYLIGHRQNNKIDKSGLTNTQKNIIDIVSQLNEKQANRVESYAIAKLEEQEEYSQKTSSKKLS